MADLTFRGSGEANLNFKAATPEEEAKKAAEASPVDPKAPLAPPTLSKEEIEKNEAEARRYLLTGGARPEEGQLTPDDAAVKRVVDEHYDRVLAESKERLEKRAPVVGYADLSPREKDMVAARNWEAISKDRTTWRSLTDDDKYEMMRFGLKNHKEVERIRDTYEQNTAWYEDLYHGGWGYIKSKKIYRGFSIGQVLGAYEGGASPADLRKAQNAKQQVADTKLFLDTLKEFRANPKAYRKEVVDSLLAKVKEKPELLTKSGMRTDPEFQATLSSLNRVEMADFMMALKEEVPSVAKRIGNAKGETFYEGRKAFSANQQPLRITDFDLDILDQKEPDGDIAFTINPLAGTGTPKALSKEEIARWDALSKQSLLKGKIEPYRWVSMAWGRGMFDHADSDTDDAIKDFGSKAVNFTPIGVADAAVSGAEVLGRQVFGPALDPTSTWGHLKSGKIGDWWRMINGDPSLADPRTLVANFDAAMSNQDEIEKASSGQKSHLIARAGAMVSRYTTEEMQASMYKYGAMNAQLVNVGMMRINPAAIVGRASAITRAGQIEGMGVFGGLGRAAEWSAKNGIVKIATKDAFNARLAVYGGYLQSLEGATLGAATRVTGWVVGKGGRVIVGAFGIAGEQVAKLAEVVASKAGMTYNPAAFKYTMRTLGITDAFFGHGISTKFAALWGFGKAAGEIGTTLQRYGYRGAARTGTGMVSTFEAMAADTSLTSATRMMSKVAANIMGPFSAPFYDFVKGTWHGAGVGYGLGFVQDGHRGGVRGIWGGVGIGGASAGLASFSQYRAGIWTHTGATADARKMAKGTVNEKIVEDLIKGAEFDRDWNRIPQLVGAVKAASGINTKVIFHRDGDTAHINGNVLRLDAVLDSDFNIGGRQYRVRELKAEVERLNQQAQTEAMSDATRDLAAETRRIAGEKNAELSIEINKWLDDIKLNGTRDQRSRINTRQNAYNGVFMEGGAGNGIIYINADRSGLLGSSGMASNTVGGHEVFHAIHKLIAREKAISYFNNSLFGISDENGLLTVQKGAMNTQMLKSFGELYIETLHADDPAGGKQAKADLDDAWSVLNDQTATPQRVKKAKELLNLYAEEFGAFYFESYLQRNRSDFLFRGGNGNGLRRLTNQLENFIDFQIQKDLNGQGIELRIRDVQALRSSNEAKDLINRLSKVSADFGRVMEQMERIVVRNPDGTVAKYKNPQLFEALAKKAERLRADKIALDKAISKQGIGEIFRTKDGKFLINPAAERAMDDLMKRIANKGASNAMDLSTIPPDELASVLQRAGLEHWADANGKLKAPEVVERETAERGQKMLNLLEGQGPQVTGIVVTQDKHGNKRGIGILTDAAIVALRDSGLLLPKEVINLSVLRDVINGVGGNGLGGSQIQFLYNALTHEYYADDGSVGKLRKPKHQVLPTFREIVPYKMEFVMTSKDRDGNVVTPHFEIMVTGIDLGVILRRGAAEFNSTYTLPSGKTVNVSDLFGGSMDVMVHHLRRYTENLSDGGLPSAELFGGGEQGEAVRDIMFRIMGAIPKGGFGPNGEALLYNNPIIRPFHAWERGPDFAFTTFRMDLMQDLSVTTGNWRLNEPNFYPKAAGNYQPPSFGAPKIVEKDGKKVTMMTASFAFEKIGKKDGISKETSVKYTIINQDKRWFVAANDFDKPYSFSTIEQAKDFVHLDSQRRKLIGSNLLGAHLMGGDKGIVVANINGNYLLVDTTKKMRIVPSRGFVTSSEAIVEATKLHNKLLIDNLRSQKHPSLRLFEHYMSYVERMQSENSELLPARLDMNRDGTPKTEALKNADGKEIKYTADDREVKNGYAKVGDTKRTLKFQKVSYSLLETLAGADHYRMGDPAVNAHAEEVAELLVQEAIDAAKDPAKKKGLGWYRNMVRDGYSIYGSVYGMFAEGQGATSARTPVKENFKQAEEALAMFSQGKYNDVLSQIHEQLRLIHEKAGRKDANGVSEFEAEAVDLLRAKEAANRANEINKTDYEWDDIVNYKNLEGEDAIPEQVVIDFVAAMKELEATPRNRLTPTQLSEGINAAKSRVFRDKANLMLRQNGKKYNANTVKVGQVMYNLWHELTEGPKTPNFAGNLAGTTRAATIDVWAARTLHRLINTKIKNRSIWRLNASMETGVDYLWHNHGTAEFPQWEVGGDFGFGQLIFEKAAARLRDRGGEFAEIMPDDLQALIWFHEKGVWDKNGWTKTIGAEMSSFEGPMSEFSGARDPDRIDDYQNIRRIVAGFAGSYDAVGITQIRGVPLSGSGSGRRFAFPKEKIQQVSGFVADALGNALRGSNIGQTIGVTAGRAEHSLMFDVIAHRGKATVLANARGLALTRVSNEARLLRQYSEQMSASVDVKVRDELQKKINTKTRDLKAAELALENADSNLQQEIQNPTVANQLGLLADYLVTQAKNYSQKDVYVAELVGEKHPNARPAGDVMFGSVLSQADAMLIAKMLSDKSPFIDAFTLIPDPRNPNAGEISRLSNEMSKLDPNSKEAKAIQKKIDGLTKYIGVQAISTPEITARYREFSKIPEIQRGEQDLLSEGGARWYMGEWSRSLNELISKNASINGTELRLNAFHISAETVPRGAFDTFNSAEIGRDVGLAVRLQRYKNGLERETALAAENQRTGDLFTGDTTVFENNRTTWAETSTERGVGGRLSETLADDASRQGQPSSKGNVVLTAEKADQWIKEKLAKPIITSEGGVVWGDKNFQMTQKRNKDGTLSNNYEIIGAFDRKPIKVTGKKKAEAMLRGRLTGEVAAQGGERIIEINGEQFKVNEATNPIFAQDSQTLVNIGVYPDTSNIFKYRPDDSPTVEFHKWNSKTVDEAFPKGGFKGSAPMPYSHRMAKYIARLNALVNRLTTQSGMVSIDLKVGSSGSDTSASYTGNWGTAHSRSFDVTIVAQGPDPYAGFPSGVRKYNVASTDGHFKAVTVTDQAAYQADSSYVQQPNDAPNRTAEDYGKISGTNAMEGATKPTVKGLTTFFGDPSLVAKYEADKAQAMSVSPVGVNPTRFGAYAEWSYFRMWLDGQRNKLTAEKDDLTDKKLAAGETLYKPDGTYVDDVQAIVDQRTKINEIRDDMGWGSNNFAHLAQVLSIEPTPKNIFELAYEIQGAGDAVNGEAGARFKAAGLFSKGSQGLKSYIVNKKGAVFKNRRNTYGEGNTRFSMHDIGNTVTYDTQEAIDINVNERVNADIKTWVDPTRLFSPSSVSFKRAFNDSALKGDGGLYSEYAEYHLPKGIGILFRTDGAVGTGHDGNISVQVVSKEINGVNFAQDFSFTVLIGYKHPADFEGAYYERPDLLQKTGEATIDYVAGLGRLNPELTVAVFRETIARLAATGIKSVRFGAAWNETIQRADGSEYRIPNLVSDSIESAMGKAPDRRKNGWEGEGADAEWDIDPKRKYSPSFVPFERLFEQRDVSAGGEFWSKQAVRELAGRYSVDFEMVRDNELREGMTDAPMGGNKQTGNPMTFITLTDSGYRSESAAEFYLMVNRDRPIEQGHTAVLQMRRKAAHITIEPIIGVIGEVIERLKMSGVTEVMIPKEGNTAADWRKVTDEYVDKMTKLYENDYDVEAADQDFITTVDEHDALKIVFAGTKNATPTARKTANGAVDVWRIDRTQKYSPSFVRFDQAFSNDTANVKNGGLFSDRARAALGGLNFTTSGLYATPNRKAIRETQGAFKGSRVSLTDADGKEVFGIIVRTSESPTGRDVSGKAELKFFKFNDPMRGKGQAPAKRHLDNPENFPSVDDNILKGFLAEIVERLKYAGFNQVSFDYSTAAKDSFMYIPEGLPDNSHPDGPDYDGARVERGRRIGQAQAMLAEVMGENPTIAAAKQDAQGMIPTQDTRPSVGEMYSKGSMTAFSEGDVVDGKYVTKEWLPAWKINPKRKYSPSQPEDSFVDRLLKTNIDKFGLTRDPYEGGYLLPNGSMLDFSGRRDATGFKREGDYFVPTGRKGRDDFLGQRYTDHREIDLPDGAAIPHQDRFSASRYNLVRAMQAAGAIRMSQMSDHTLLDIGLKPTTSQLLMIKDLLRDNNTSRSISLDLRDTTRMDENGWEREAGLQYPAGTDPSKVVRDINRFYAGNDVSPDFSPSGAGSAESAEAARQMRGERGKYKENPHLSVSHYYQLWKANKLAQGDKGWWDRWNASGGSLEELIFVWQMSKDINADNSSMSLAEFKELVVSNLAANRLKYDQMSLKEQNAMDLLLFMDAFSGITYETGENPLAKELLNSQVRLDVRNERSSARSSDESDLMTRGDKWFSSSPDFSTLIEEWNHMLYGSMMDKTMSDHKRWETILNPPSLLEGRRQTAGVKTKRRFIMAESEAQHEGLSAIPRMQHFSDAPSYIAAMRAAMAERIGYMKNQHRKFSNLILADTGQMTPFDTSQELARDIIRQAAMHTIVESWLRILEGTQARDMASMRDSLYVKRARKDLGREPTAADLALARVDPRRLRTDREFRTPSPFNSTPIPEVGASGYKYSLEGPRTYDDPKGTAWHKDYNFVTIVEFVAGVLKSPQTQVYLSDLPPMEKSPLDDILQHLEQNGEGESKQYATELNSLWSKSVNVFQQLMASIRLYAQVFSSKTNWQEKMKRGEADPRAEIVSQYANKPEAQKPTLLSDAVKAAFMLRPRSLTTETTTYQRRNKGVTETAEFSASGLDAVSRALQQVRTTASVVDSQGTIYPNPNTIPHFLEARKKVSEGSQIIAKMAEDVKKAAAEEAALKAASKDAKSEQKRTLNLYNPKIPDNTVIFVEPRRLFWALHSEVQMHRQDGRWDGRGRTESKKYQTPEGMGNAVDWKALDTPEVRDLVARYKELKAQGATASLDIPRLYRSEMGYGWSELSLFSDQGQYSGRKQIENWIKAMALHAPEEAIPIQVPKKMAPWFTKHFGIVPPDNAIRIK
jgi:hypothetical protein